jgi:DeoR family transcriptional regulator of aga operon
MDQKSSARVEKILELVRANGSVEGEELSKSLGVSIATIRRDLQDLDEKGLLRRTHGGAKAIGPLFYEPFWRDSSFQEQVDRFAEEKRRIGFAACELVEDGDIIAVTPGTTTMEVVRSIRRQKGVTLVTSTVNIAMELSHRKDIEVIVTGGHLRGNWFSMVGPLAVHAASRIFPDKMFIGVNGIDTARGLTSLSPEEAELIAVLMRQSRRRFVVVDHSKLGAVASYLIAPTEGIEALITDTGASEEQIAPFLAKGIEVRRV